MAIIVKQAGITDNFDVDPNYSISGSGAIYAGMLVTLNSSGYVAKAGAANALGIAGDAIASEYQTTAFSADLVISPTGKTRWTQNRVENYFDETAASGKMTVYTGSGRFATDQFVTGASYVPGEKLYSNGSGKFTRTDPGSGRVVGYVLEVAHEEPSGVPGADSPAVSGSMSLGTYLTVQLSI